MRLVQEKCDQKVFHETLRNLCSEEIEAKIAGMTT
jgi:hypothetical protein